MHKINNNYIISIQYITPIGCRIIQVYIVNKNIEAIHK